MPPAIELVELKGRHSSMEEAEAVYDTSIRVRYKGVIYDTKLGEQGVLLRNGEAVAIFAVCELPRGSFATAKIIRVISPNLKIPSGFGLSSSPSVNWYIWGKNYRLPGR